MTHVLIFSMTSSTQSESSSSIVTSTSSPILLANLHHHISLKLTQDSYMLWRFLMTSYLEAHELFGYVDGSIICPPQLVPCPTSSTTLVPNPEYQFWVQQDKLILSAIISTLSKIVLTHVVGLQKSLDIWTTLEKMFASQSKARIVQIRLQLATLKKGDSSIADYFQKAQTLAHTLAAIDEPLKESEVITYILAGLSTDYDSLVTTVSTHVDPISLEDLYGHLLTHEQRIELHNTAPDISSSSVNVAQRHSSINHASRGSHNSRGYSYAGRGKGRGRGRGPSSHGHFSSSNSNNQHMC